MFVDPLNEPPYDPFKYYGGHPDENEAPLLINYEKG